jgi:hypothetical protein
MALDPAVLNARIDLRVYRLKLLGAWTAVNSPRQMIAGYLCVPKSYRREDFGGLMLGVSFL